MKAATFFGGHGWPVILLGASLSLGCGCSTAPGIKEVRRPLAADPEVRQIVDTRRVSAESRAVLKGLGLEGRAARDPGGAIAALAPQADDAGPLDPRRLALAEMLCIQGAAWEDDKPEEAIGCYLEAARIAYPAAIDSQDSLDQTKLLALYNHACARLAVTVFAIGLPADGTAEVTSPLGERQVRVVASGPGRFDPAYFDELKMTENLRIKGYQTRETVPGVGGKLVGHRAHTAERQVDDPFLHPIGLALPVTATLHFSEDREQADLALHDVLATDQTRLGAEDFQLAADFTAPLALLSSLTPAKNVGRKAMFHPAKFLGSTGIYRLEPQREGKIPVVLVHGLSKTPAVWAEAVNELRADPRIRERYQFFYFQYPSGFPAGFCASALRHHLDRYREHADPARSNPHHRRMVLVGKSFGGVISSFQVRDSGDSVRKLFVEKPLAELNLPPHQRQTLQAMLHFEANPDISRVVFMVTPHLGTDVAEKPLAKMASRAIKVPVDLITDGEVPEFEGMTDLARAYLNESTNSMVNLRPHSPVLTTVRGLPTRPGLKIHSIVGKIGHGPLEESNDKMVPYWSSHLDEALSEVVVPTKHGNITHHPDAIAELRRILTLHLAE